MARPIVTIFGASGFIGRQVVRKMAARGWLVRACVRDEIRAEALRPMGEVGQVVPLRVSITDPAQVAAAIAGADAVINLVGILFERGASSFQSIHVTGAANVAQAAAQAGVAHLVHMSALGVSKDSPADYARTKALGEDAVKAAFANATIIRPSVVFGPDDYFFNRFAGMARISPVLPVFVADGFKLVHKENGYGIDLFGSGGPVLQPVFVGDVAEAMVRPILTPALAGRTYELGGPRRYSLTQIMQLINKVTLRDRLIVPVPFWVAKIQAKFLQYLPKPPLTPDQVKMLEVNNVVSGGLPGLKELGIAPTSVEAMVPTYMHRYRD